MLGISSGCLPEFFPVQSENNLEKGWREVHLSCGRLESSGQPGIPVGNGSVLKTNTFKIFSLNGSLVE